MTSVKTERRCTGEPCQNSNQQLVDNDNAMSIEIMKQIIEQQAVNARTQNDANQQMVLALLSSMQQNAQSSDLKFKEMFQFFAANNAEFRQLQFSQQKEIVNSMRQTSTDGGWREFANGALEVVGPLVGVLPSIVGMIG